MYEWNLMTRANISCVCANFLRGVMIDFPIFRTFLSSLSHSSLYKIHEVAQKILECKNSRIELWAKIYLLSCVILSVCFCDERRQMVFLSHLFYSIWEEKTISELLKWRKQFANGYFLKFIIHFCPLIFIFIQFQCHLHSEINYPRKVRNLQLSLVYKFLGHNYKNFKRKNLFINLLSCCTFAYFIIIRFNLQ